MLCPWAEDNLITAMMSLFYQSLRAAVCDHRVSPLHNLGAHPWILSRSAHALG
jgi:hypothetical protein